MPRHCSSSLPQVCVTLALYLRSASADHEMEDRGHLTWEPVHLLPMAAEFVVTGGAEGQVAYDPSCIRTKDGQVSIERMGEHIGTVKQSRFGLLAAACGSEELYGPRAPLAWSCCGSCTRTGLWGALCPISNPVPGRARRGVHPGM